MYHVLGTIPIVVISEIIRGTSHSEQTMASTDDDLLFSFVNYAERCLLEQCENIDEVHWAGTSFQDGTVAFELDLVDALESFESLQAFVTTLQERTKQLGLVVCLYMVP